MFLLDLLYYTFIAVVSIQVFFYLLFFGRYTYTKPKKQTQSNIPVSVIICAKNEAENLKTFLPSIIAQDYPDFEIVLINDASRDETAEVMEHYAKLHDHIKIVTVRNTEAFWGNKKYALTLGIKAAKNNLLLFTDADCKPTSKLWIKKMSKHFNDKKTIILGYGSYAKHKKSLLNKLIRFETLMTATLYFSFAKLGIPYMGVGRNLAYTKDQFFNANGFVNHMKILSGDDDLFINQVATKQNTAICFSKGSFTESLPKTSLDDWFKQKRRHVSTAKHYKFIHKILLTLIYFSQFLFWSTAILLFISGFNLNIVIPLFICRLLIQYIILGLSAKKLGETDVLFLLPFLEIFLIISQLAIFINNLISKPNHWK